MTAPTAGLLSKLEGSRENQSKRAAIGTGNSPSSSVKTSYSYDVGRLIKTDGASPTHALSKEQHKRPATSRQSREGVPQQSGRPPVTGKRLFEPDFDRTTTGQIPTNTALSQPRSLHTQQLKTRDSQNPVSQIQQRPRAGFEPKPIPINILNVHPTMPQEGSNPEQLDIVLQPETRPISQEQLVIE